MKALRVRVTAANYTLEFGLRIGILWGVEHYPTALISSP
jgi:hypothetical protein